VSGRVLFDRETQLGTATTPLRVQDKGGHPLSISKTGHLGRSFSERDPELTEALLTAASAAIAVIADEVPAFLAFGGLLGAVRDGHLIGHDVDLDLGYLSKHTTPMDAARESFHLERLFVRAGWRTWRFSADDFKVFAQGVSTAARWIDIFGGFVANNVFYLMPNVAAPRDSINILPLGEIELEGHVLPAPADPAALLEATYGPGWRTPDPSFKFHPPRATVRRLDGWMRGAIANRSHWNPFYESGRSRQVPTTASAFATWCAERVEPGTHVVDLGCGTGRDAIWFAGQGFEVTGLDYAPPAIRRAQGFAAKAKSSAQFRLFNLYDLRHVLVLGGQLSHEPGPLAIYARFLLHSLTDQGRRNLWLLARSCVRGNARLYLEFRADADPAEEFAFGEHYRQFLSSAEVAEEITASGGRVEFQEEGHGMALYKNEDPHVCRMVATWQR
jgi:SAM-dependent methyltransferase